MGNGPLLMSNLFLSAALITLAEKEIDCFYADDDIEHDECGTLYGLFKPSSLITITATISGILSALILPFIGAILDCTDHRHKLGSSVALAMIFIQAAQIGTFQSTWLFMAILQALNGMLNWTHVLATCAYLPGIAAVVGETVMIQYSAEYAVTMFTSQILYLVLCIGIGLAMGLGDSNEETARLSQSVSVLVSGLFYYIAWHFFTSVPAQRQLDEAESLVTAGFIHVFKTAKGIKDHYRSTLGYFFLAVIFSEAGTHYFY